MDKSGGDICEGALPGPLGTWPMHTSKADCFTLWHLSWTEKLSQKKGTWYFAIQLLEDIRHCRIPTRGHGGWIVLRVGTGCTLALATAQIPPWLLHAWREEAGCATIGDHPANLRPGFFRQVLCYTFRKAYTGCVTVLKNRIWHRDSFHINLLVLKHKEMLKVFTGKFISPFTELKQMAWHHITLPLFRAFSFSSLCSSSNLKWKIPAGDPVFLVVP